MASSIRCGWQFGLSAMVLGMAALPTDAATLGPAPPAFVHGEVLITAYPAGGGDDLLTGGLGAARLADPTPVPVEPVTAAALRTAAIYGNYRALVDTSSGGGYGRLYGPLVPPTTADADGKIYGVEYLAYAKGRGGDQNVTMLVQIPDAFDPAHACLVAGPSSGSRGVYGAIGTAGEWGLKHGCAVAYTDAGKGTGAHNLELDTRRAAAGPAHRRRRRGRLLELHRRSRRCRAGGLQCRVPEPLCLEARAFPAQPRGRLGPAGGAVAGVRPLGDQPSARQQGAAGTWLGRHAGDRIQRLQRRRGLAAGGRDRAQGHDRRRRRLGAQRQPDLRPAVHDPAG